VTVALALLVAACGIALAYLKGELADARLAQDNAEDAAADLEAALAAEKTARAEDAKAAADLAGVLIKRVAEQRARLRVLETPASVAERLDGLGEAVEK